MAKKKKSIITQLDKGNDSPLNKQVIEGDTLTIAQVKDFIAQGKKGCREDWLNIAERSWNEIKKRNRRGKLYGGNDLDRVRRWARFPLWWSCFQIRQPLTLARLPIPIIKDTQGDDPIGRTACVVGERLTRGILKTFDAFSEFQAANDDFLVTDFGWGRVYYRMKECTEEEKVRLQEMQQEPQEAPEPMGQMDPEQGPGEPQQQPPQEPLPPIFITPDGQQVDEPLFDEFGPYIKTGEMIEVEQEEVYFEAGLYCNFYIDDVNRYAKATRIAFEYQYSYREFKEKFGQSALDKLSIGDIELHKMGQPIKVFEYHDKFLKEIRYFAENSDDFFQPKGMTPDELKEVGETDNSDIYGLNDYFPCSAPLITNTSTDEFWPTPEYFQVADILDDVHSIVGRMVLLTKAIRVRFFFDSSVPMLKQLVGETGEGGGLGIPNLEASLMNAKGSLANLVAYFPVDEMIQGLNNMYTAFEQRLNMFYNITGISDLLRGQTTDGDKTYGERQLEGKFALNRIEPRQRKVQEWIKDQYQLLMELALKMFSDKTIDDYITPQTLDDEDKQRYVPALELLKANKRSRFRMDFETDSTIAINEQWKKQQAIELANTLTKAMEAVAKTAETQPELAGTELKVLKHLIGEFSDGKLFIDEIQDSIEQVIQKVSQPQPPEPNVEMEKLKLEGQRFQFETQKQSTEDRFREMELQSKTQIEIEKINRDDRIAQLDAQIAQFKTQTDFQLRQIKIQDELDTAHEALQLDYAKIQADIQNEQGDLEIKRQQVLVELKKITDKKDFDQLSLILQKRVDDFQAQLEVSRLEMEKVNSSLDIKERYITEARLQQEEQMKETSHKFEQVHGLLDAALKHKELTSPDLKQTVASSEPKAAPKKQTEKKTKVIRDKNGDITELVTGKKRTKVGRDKNGDIAHLITTHFEDK